MKTFITMIGLLATLSVAGLSPAAAATQHKQSFENQNAGYETIYQDKVDTQDRASTPYQGGVG
jgi:hypothetical protein